MRPHLRLVAPTLALALLWALTAQASAAAPAHQRHPALDVEGLNHACGAAVDSEGDLYLSSAGDEEVKVLGPEHAELASLANSNEPCAVAVTSEGTLYVSEQGTGFVVRYAPAKYPFEGAPSYGGREVIDESGEAEGIAVDPFDDRLYVAEGSHVAAYDSAGNLGVDEKQRVNCLACTKGTYRLIFAGEETEPIPYEGPAAEVEERLLELTAFEAGDVSVENGANDKIHLISFGGKYARTDVEALQCEAAGLGGSGSCNIVEEVKGFDGLIEAGLEEATGVAPYVYEAAKNKLTYHLAVADAASEELKLFSAPSFTEQQPRRTLPEEGEEALGFGAQGAYLGSDPGSCPPAGQACTEGHFFFYDAERELIEEYEASGALVSQTPFEEADGQPTAIAVDRSGTEDDGTLYVTTGAGAGARALAFFPLPAPSRSGPEEPPLSLTLAGARGIDVDDYGNRYVAAEASIAIFGPEAEEPLLEIEPSEEPRQVKVDSDCNVYARTKEKIVYFAAPICPPTSETTYGSQTTITLKSDFLSESADLKAIAVNPANDRFFASNAEQTIEYKSIAEGSGIVDPEFGAGVGVPSRESIAVYGANGNVYITAEGAGGGIFVLDEAGETLLTRITGAGSPLGSLTPHPGAIAVDQSNGHVIVFDPARETALEYEATGAFVTSFGTFTNAIIPYDVAVDNGSESPNRGSVYIAFDDTNPEIDPYDLTAFGPLSYGEPPLAKTGLATEIDGEAGESTLNGSVDPNGFEVEACHFAYLTEAVYQANEEAEEPPFVGAEEAECEPGPAELGEGTDPVAVEAHVEGLNLEGRYRFRLVAENKYGPSEEGTPGILGPPLAGSPSASPVLYDEAALHAQVDPSGLPTAYRFEFLTQTEYEANLEAAEPPFQGAQSAPEEELGPNDGFLAAEAFLEDLQEGTTYRFRAMATNDAGQAQVEGQFVTLEEPPNDCLNSAHRTGPSAALPDCRAYELVTPAQTGGYIPLWGVAPATNGNFATALATADGESMVFKTEGPLPGMDGNGSLNGYRARRGTDGWSSHLYGPTFAEISSPLSGGVSADHGYAFWTAKGGSGSLVPPGGTYARYISLPEAGADPACGPEPNGRFELVGCGSLGIDPEALGRWISPGAEHVIFASAAHLEPETPPEGKEAVYDRSPGGQTHVVSLLPGDEVPSEDASYRGISADGSAVAFNTGGTLYLRRHNSQTLAVGGSAFAGLARDGSALFHAQGGTLYRYDVEAEESTQIASGGGATFVNVAAEGTAAYFVSTEALAAGAEAGADNLYLWEAEGETTSFVALLDHSDVTGDINLTQWAKGLSPEAGGLLSGPAIDPSRSSADGKTLLFESHAPLTGYESAGHTEVFRYDSVEGSLACLSCGPEGTVAEADAKLQDESLGASMQSALAPIANLSEDGDTAFFTTAEALLPADRNGLADVYGWREGRLALISTGQSIYPSYLYAVGASGDDVFFSTYEALAPSDEAEGGLSIYDARVEGGFPPPPPAEVCGGENCRLPATDPPDLKPELPTTSPSTQGATGKSHRHRCPKGKRKVKRKGRVRCVKRKGKKRRRAHLHHRRRAR